MAILWALSQTFLTFAGSRDAAVILRQRRRTRGAERRWSDEAKGRMVADGHGKTGNHPDLKPSSWLDWVPGQNMPERLKICVSALLGRER